MSPTTASMLPWSIASSPWRAPSSRRTRRRSCASRWPPAALAWRGYFPAGDELTSGRPDWKEGLYLGSELGPEHPRVRDGVILHGANLWPDIAGFRETVLAYIDALEALGHALMRGCALGLGLDENYFAQHGTADPLLLLRLFNYPTRPVPRANLPVQWGVGEHTDYGC
jgi:isopenicillin N synthase-like dioxygenase